MHVLRLSLSIVLMAACNIASEDDVLSDVDVGSVFPSQAVNDNTTPLAINDCSDCNFVVIVVDTLRASHTSLHGHNMQTTPAMARAAEQGVMFSRAYSSGTWTVPSVGSMLSLGTPIDTNLRFFWAPSEAREAQWTPWAESVVPIAELMQEKGLSTHALIQQPVVQKDLGFGEGFDHWSEFERPNPADQAPEPPVSNATIVAAIKEFKRLAASDERFFMYIHLFGPHIPLYVEARYRSMFTTDGNVLRYPKNGFNYNRRGQNFVAAYQQQTRAYDDAVNRLLAELEATGLDQDTYILVTSDHGESLGDEGEAWGHGRESWESRTHVPTILLGANVPKGLRINDVVGNTDVIATVLYRMGITPRPAFPWRAVDLTKERPEFVLTLQVGRQLAESYALRTQDGLKMVIQTNGKAALYSLFREKGGDQGGQ